MSKRSPHFGLTFVLLMCIMYNLKIQKSPAISGPKEISRIGKSNTSRSSKDNRSTIKSVASFIKMDRGKNIKKKIYMLFASSHNA